MYSSTAILAILAAGFAAAAPYEGTRALLKRAGVTDDVILNYALTLEHLEDTFYRDGLNQFTMQDFQDAGFDETFYNNIMKVGQDEADHVSFISGALEAAGATPVEPCTYAFGVTDVMSFIATASVLEGVGVSAYLGAAADIMSKTYLTAAGSILTVEARHNAYIRNGLKQSPFPQAFDAPLSYNEVYSLASQFITSCPESNPPLPVKAFPQLMLDASDSTIEAGTTITLLTPDYTLEVPEGVTVYAAFIAVTGPTFVEATAVEGGFTAEVPEGFHGQTYVVLTGCEDIASDDTIAAGPAIVEVA